MELLSIQNEWLDKLDIEAQKVNILSDDYSMLQDSIMSAFAEKGEESFAQNYNGYLSASQKVNKKDSYILNTGYYNSPEFDQLLEENGFFHYNDMMTGVPALSVMIEDVTQEELIQKYSNISNQLDSIDSLSAEEKKNIRKELSAQLTKYNTEVFKRLRKR